MLRKLEWYATMFPRIPVKFAKEIDEKLKNYNSATVAAPYSDQQVMTISNLSIKCRDVTGLNFTGSGFLPDFKVPDSGTGFPILGVGKNFDYLCNRVVFFVFFSPDLS